MLSGVGPAQHLSSLGIPVVKDLPVGDNLCNHPTLFGSAFIRDPSLVGRRIRPSIEQMYEANVNGTGPWAQSPISIWFRTSPSRPPSDYPDQVIYSYPLQNLLPDFLRSMSTEWNVHVSLLEYLLDMIKHDNLILAPTLTRPYSRGTIRLKSTNPYDMPLIDPRLLRDSRDMQNFIELVSFTINLVENSSLAQVCYVNPLPIPGCSYCPDRPVSECESYIRCYIRQITSTMWHPVGTCRMGDPNASHTVVDTRLKVKGIRNLRVVDSSVYPNCINANTNAPAMLVGEMGANFILHEHKCT